MANVAAITRSRIVHFDQTATTLSQLAGQMRIGATQWQNSAEAYVEQVDAPNGTEWTGQAANRYFNDAHADRSVVNSAAEQAHSIADVAEHGADSLRGARESALAAITQAEEDNFTVGEDLSVSDQRPPARRPREPPASRRRSGIATTSRTAQADCSPKTNASPPSCTPAPPR